MAKQQKSAEAQAAPKVGSVVVLKRPAALGEGTRPRGFVVGTVGKDGIELAKELSPRERQTVADNPQLTRIADAAGEA